LAGVSAFPEVTKLVLSVVWTLAPVQMLLCAGRLHLRPNWSAISRHRIASTFILLIVGFAVVSLAVLYEMRPSDLEGWTISERVLKAVSTSRLWLGLVAGFMVSAAAMVLYVILFELRHFHHIYFRESSD
jgi:hypothetical protein